jgi:transposase
MYQNHPQRRYRQRAHIILLSASGYSQKEIAKIVRATEPTVAKYIKLYKEHGFLGLYDAPIPGRPPKVTEDIQNYIDSCLNMNPRDQGYNISGWTISLMQHHLWTRFGIRVCLETIRLWFLRLGYSLIFPRYKLLEGNPKEIEKAQQEIAELLEQAKRGEIVLIFMDESIFKMLPTLTRIWAKKGSKPEIPTYDDKRRIVITGGTDPVAGKTHFRLSSSDTKEAALEFLKQIRRNYPESEIVVVLDNDSSHKAKIVKEYVAQDQKMRLKPLPSYAPQLNIQENIWKWLRKRVTHNYLFEDMKALGNGIRDAYRYLQGHPEKVISLSGNV